MRSTLLLVLNCLLLAVACSSKEESVSSIHQGLTTALHIQATQAAIEQSLTQCPQETRDAIANMSWQLLAPRGASPGCGALPPHG